MYNTAELFVMASNPDTSKEVFLNNVTLSVEDDASGCVDLDAQKTKLENIWKIAHMPFKEMVEETGLMKTAFAKMAGVPYRTLQGWCGETRECPVYIRFLLAEHYKLL
jgi:DNA-binding transcriptional regulator YiaG